MSQFSHPFLNPEFSQEQRIEDLIERLTPAEKTSLLRWDSPSIERLGIPAYNWWTQ